MQAFRLDELDADRHAKNVAYLEFLREQTLSAGLYGLDVLGTDPQSPHTEDEVYIVLSGRATITVGSETAEVVHGSVVYVPAGVAHRFHNISEDLRVVAVFTPPES
ncbi:MULTISPECIES: cupin domain-containing protein [unclassified Nocardia]|uniref:cupin domain-containing protein n=1 Tax=unclassified Nocardia TaxID=2637762 RepID=UPI001CE3F696|nr:MULTISPECIES: cupin domain-containing protein [unclassified Nocardia]